MKRNRKIERQSKGFTLAELLIVVAIIAVLVAIAIPIFTSQLEKSREATDLSNVRSAYTEVMMAALTQDTDAAYTKDNSKIYQQNGDYQIVVQPLKQKQNGWQMQTPLNIGGVSSDAGNPYWIGVPVEKGYCKITYHTAEDYVSFEWSGTGDSTGGSDSAGGSDSSGDSKPSGGNDSGNDYSAIEIPDQPQNFSVEAGKVYSFKGKKYVALNTENFSAHYYRTPEQTDSEYLYVELRENESVKTSADLKLKDGNSTAVLENLQAGSLYRTDNGELYIYKYSSQGSTNVPPPDARWQKIESIPK